MLRLRQFSSGVDEAPVSALWGKFETTRQGARYLHQEFEVTERVGHRSRHQIIVDFSQNKWREQSVGGSDNLTRIFDGQDLFLIDTGGTEYIRGKRQGDKDTPLPEPYEMRLDWGKAKQLQLLPCGFSGKDHTCVVIEAPIKP